MSVKNPEEIKEVLDIIKSRRSIRKYLEVPVEWDKVANIVEAGRYAPSSGNIQNFRFIVCTDKAKRTGIANACLEQDWMLEAPVHIVVVCDFTMAKQYYGVRGERLYSIQNCAAAVQNMMVAATALGLGSCWVGAFEEDELINLLKIPSYVRPQAVITLGYSNEAPPVPPSYTVEHMVYLENWGSKIRDGAMFENWFYLGTKAKKHLGNLAGKLGKAIGKKIDDKKTKQKSQELTPENPEEIQNNQSF